MLFELLKSFVLIVLGFVLYHFVKTALLNKTKIPVENRKKNREILSEIEKNRVQLTPKEKRKMERELKEYYDSIVAVKPPPT